MFDAMYPRPPAVSLPSGAIQTEISAFSVDDLFVAKRNEYKQNDVSFVLWIFFD